MMAVTRPRTRAEASRERRTARAAVATRHYKSATARSPRSLMGGERPAVESASARRRARGRGRSRYERASFLPAVSLVLPDLPSIRLGWRTASLAIAIMFGALLFYVMSTPAYFVNSINLAGAVHVSAEEIYDASGLNRMHVFWVEPDVIRANVEQVPGIASARVELKWPNLVTVTVVERQPVLEWQAGGESLWVDRSGAMFPARGVIADLLPVVVDEIQKPLDSVAARLDKAQFPGEAETPAPEAAETVPVEAIAGALQLRELRPNIELLHYDPIHGLSYQDGRGWRGYFGAGGDMQVKLNVYETLVADLVSRGIQPAAISVANPDAPYYSK